MSFQQEPVTPGKKFQRTMEPSGGHRGPSMRIIGAALLTIAMIVFIVANGHATRISFAFFKWDTTVRWSIFIAFLAGVVLDRLAMWGSRRRKQEEQQNE